METNSDFCDGRIADDTISMFGRRWCTYTMDNDMDAGIVTECWKDSADGRRLAVEKKTIGETEVEYIVRWANGKSRYSKMKEKTFADTDEMLGFIKELPHA